MVWLPTIPKAWDRRFPDSPAQRKMKRCLAWVVSCKTGGLRRDGLRGALTRGKQGTTRSLDVSSRQNPESSLGMLCLLSRFLLLKFLIAADNLSAR